ncbi:hypothetical protein SAMN04487926_12129 [Paraburkholderia steynii]|uniref:Uncharacterized protein n=1 Tax=Paraburkholderia steynii TaxID=1245441 RepID=A0A7Z7BEF2_9BURK|nr:hypothetical protein [Paraburkholderia steynii]SDI64747.1 hypothetical protein SAMN04487926_12129 [Paraburkholderia steynii]
MKTQFFDVFEVAEDGVLGASVGVCTASSERAAVAQFGDELHFAAFPHEVVTRVAAEAAYFVGLMQ